MSLPILFILLWVLVSSSCLVISGLLSSTTPFLPTYWCSLGLLQGILLRFYSSKSYQWALTSGIFGVSLYVLLASFFLRPSSGGNLSSKAFLFSPSSALNGWLFSIFIPSIPNLSTTNHDLLPLALLSAVVYSLFMFAGGAFLGDIQQRALGIRFSCWWLLASGLVWTVGTLVFLVGTSILFLLLDFSKDDALIILLPISGAAGSFIKGISLVFLFNRERLRNLYE